MENKLALEPLGEHENHAQNHIENDIKGVLIILVVTSILQLLSILAYMYNGYKERDETRVQNSLSSQFYMLQRQYDRQDKKYKEIIYPLTSLRANLEGIEKICSKGIMALTLDDRNLLADDISQRMKNKIALVQANGASQIVFGDALHNNIGKLIQKVETIEKSNAICPPDSKNHIISKGEQVEAADSQMFNSMAETRKQMIYIAKEMKGI